MKSKSEEPKVIISSFEFTGEETDEQCKEIAWKMFCQAHPVEACRSDPEAFWKYFHEIAPNITREQMEATVRECEKESK